MTFFYDIYKPFPRTKAFESILRFKMVKMWQKNFVSSTQIKLEITIP